MKLQIVALAFLAACEKQPPKEPPKPFALGVELPEVTGGLMMAENRDPDVIITKTAIVVGNKELVAIRAGKIDPTELEGGQMGMVIFRVRDAARTLTPPEQKPGPHGELTFYENGPPVVIALDRTTPYSVFMQTLFSLKQRGLRNFRVLTRDHGKLVAAAIMIPDRAAIGADGVYVGAVGKPIPATELVRISVAIEKTKLVLWSISGLEGTLMAPKVAAAPGDYGALTAALAEIVQRRWNTAPRPTGDRNIIVMVEGDRPMQEVVSVIAATRVTADGTELFPNVLLSSGFE
jgi:hypothetical protein